MSILEHEKLDVFKQQVNLSWLFSRLPFSPNVYTFLGLVSGCLGAYYLFVNHFLFIFFCLLHLFFDVCDGGLARYTQTTSRFGQWFDFTVDRVVQLLLLLKVAFLFPWAFVVVGVYIVHNLVYVYFQKTVYYSRTLMMGFFALQLYVVGVAFVGLVSVYGLFRQLFKSRGGR